MELYRETLERDTTADTDILDLTADVEVVVAAAGVERGWVVKVRVKVAGTLNSPFPERSVTLGPTSTVYVAAGCMPPWTPRGRCI